MKLNLIFLLLMLPSFSGCDRSIAVQQPQPATSQIARDYHQLHLMTAHPVFVDPGLAALCRGISQSDVDKARSKSGPHANTQVSIYMSEPAVTTFTKSSTPYPVGAIIIKEKKDVGIRGGAADHHNGVGGMIKRPPGYDPTHGDWEYFYFEDPAKLETGKITSCVQCHSGASSKDYVFGNWAIAKR